MDFCLLFRCRITGNRRGKAETRRTAGGEESARRRSDDGGRRTGRHRRERRRRRGASRRGRGDHCRRRRRRRGGAGQVDGERRGGGRKDEADPCGSDQKSVGSLLIGLKKRFVALLSANQEYNQSTIASWERVARFLIFMLLFD